jgi:hypothetical protein
LVEGRLLGLTPELLDPGQSLGDLDYRSFSARRGPCQSPKALHAELAAPAVNFNIGREIQHFCADAYQMVLSRALMLGVKFLTAVRKQLEIRQLLIRCGEMERGMHNHQDPLVSGVSEVSA